MFKEEMRYDYPLAPDSLVWDIGGYKGDFAQKIYDKYGCGIDIFEPIPEFSKIIAKRFNTLPHMWVWQYGLSNETKNVCISINKDSSSMYRGGKDIEIQLVDINDDMASHIDLMKINIEGEEYNLLERMLECDIIKQVKYIQVQFHAFIPNAKERRAKIQEGLKKTHKLMWNYDFIWESWERI